METISQKLPVDEGQAALVMAVGIVFERMVRLSEEDRNDVYKLFKGLQDAKTRDDIDELRCAFYEILDQVPIRGSHMPPVTRPERLAKWASHVGAQVKALRESRGWSQTELAERAGLSDQAHVSRIESGEISPSSRTIEKLADAMQVTIGKIDPTED